MTRGRAANTAHLVAGDAAEAREQWLAAFARDRADLGPAHAAELAAAEAAAYAPARPLEQVLAELRAAWTDEQNCRDRLHLLQLRRAALDSRMALHAESAHRVSALEAACARAAADATTAGRLAEASAAGVAADADRIYSRLLARWGAEREAARHAAHVTLGGPGRFGLGRGAVARAHAQLTDWLDEWTPHLPALRVDLYRLTELAAGPDDPFDVPAGLRTAARRAADAAHPDHPEIAADARAAQRDHDLARHELDSARSDHDNRFGDSTPADTARRLADAEEELAATGRQLTEARARITVLQAEPAIQAQPERLARELHAWRDQRDAADRSDKPTAHAHRPVRTPRQEDLLFLQRSQRPSPGPGIGR